MSLTSAPAEAQVRVPVHEHGQARVPDGVRLIGVLAHNAAVAANWHAFHADVPEGFANYVYRYRDGEGGLVYVGMTSDAAYRAGEHWQTSDWWSWVMSVEYTRCHNRNEAFKLESKIRNEEHPLFTRRHGYVAIIAALDAEYMTNHVTGQCYCGQIDMLAEVGNPVVDSPQSARSGRI